MRYLGSKHRLAKKIAEIVHSIPHTAYYEPFLGSAAVLERIETPVRIASDVDTDLIAFWQAVKAGWIPPGNLSKPAYLWAKANQQRVAPYLRGFIGFFCSYGGKKWGGYAQGDGRNFAAEARRGALKRAPYIKSAAILEMSYQSLTPWLTDGALIYCDPPYNNTTGYTHKFDSDTFWETTQIWLKAGCTVLVSEYNIPVAHEICYSKEQLTTLDTAGNYGKRNEIIARLTLTD